MVNGLVNAILGSAIGFDEALESDRALFSKALYVGIAVDADWNPNTPDLEMVPRQVYIPAVAAITAQNLQGYSWSDILVGGSSDPTTGRPVYLSLIGADSYPAGDPQTFSPKESAIEQRQTNSTSRYISFYRILRDGDSIYQVRYKIDGWNVGEATEYALPPGMIQTVDFPPPGVHNDNVQIYSNAAFANAYFLRLFAMEL